MVGASDLLVQILFFSAFSTHLQVSNFGRFLQHTHLGNFGCWIGYFKSSCNCNLLINL